MNYDIELTESALDADEQRLVTAGFEAHSRLYQAPVYESQPLAWKMYSSSKELIAVLTARLLWDWVYIDELFVTEAHRGNGLGKRLMQEAELHAVNDGLAGLWLWTQSWQAEDFYKQLGYEEFCRFPDFPKGYERIGLRKNLAS